MPSVTHFKSVFYFLSGCQITTSPQYLVFKFYSCLILISGFLGNILIIYKTIRKIGTSQTPRHIKLILASSMFSLSYIILFIIAFLVPDEKEESIFWHAFSQFFSRINHFGLILLLYIFSVYKLCRIRFPSSNFMEMFELFPLMACFTVFNVITFAASWTMNKNCAKLNRLGVNSVDLESFYLTLANVFVASFFFSLPFVVLVLLWINTPRVIDTSHYFPRQSPPNSLAIYSSCSHRSLRMLVFTVSVETTLEERIFLNRIKVLIRVITSVFVIFFILHILDNFLFTLNISTHYTDVYNSSIIVGNLNEAWIVTTEAIHVLHNPLVLSLRFWRKVPRRPEETMQLLQV